MARLLMARPVLVLLWLFVLIAAPVSAQEPVRLGVLTIRSGPIASCGRQMEEGLQYALKERGGLLAGRKVDVFFGDSAGQPAQTRAKTLELVERNKVHVLTGPVAAFEAYAISDYVRQTETPMVISPAAADDITQRKTNPWFVRATMSGSQVTHPLGEYVAKIPADVRGKRRQDRAEALAADRHARLRALHRPAEDQRRCHLRGLRADQRPAIPQAVLRVRPEAARARHGDDHRGIEPQVDGRRGAGRDHRRKWVQAMRAEYKDDPGYCTIGGYLGVLFIEAGMKGVNGRVEDKAAFIKALRAVQLPDTPQGPIRLDGYGNPIVNVYIRKVERREGRLMNVVIDTYRDVSQFWKYDPATFLAAPVYSRDYPPAKNIE